jgi:type III pantothenate kinase
MLCSLFDGLTIKTRWRITTDPRRTADEYAVWLLQLMAIEGIERAAVSRIIVSTVVPRAHNFRVLASKYFGVDLLVAGEGEAAYGIVVDVVEPKSLGADRAVNAIAAHAKYPGDLIVVDFGTATTIDHIDAAAPTGRDHRAGHQPSLDALLVAGTAKLPRIAIAEPETDSVIGRTPKSDADRHLLGLCGDDGGLIARMRADRPPGHGGGHRRSGRAVRQAARPVRRG